MDHVTQDSHSMTTTVFILHALLSNGSVTAPCHSLAQSLTMRCQHVSFGIVVIYIDLLEQLDIIVHTFFYNNRKLTATSGGSVVVDTGFAVKTGTSILGLLDPLAMSSGAKTLIACTKFSATLFLRLYNLS